MVTRAPEAHAAASPECPPDEFITLTAAARAGRCHRSTVMRLALAGAIRTRTLRGRVLYHAEDCRRQLDA
jgi:hypothetical protein